MNLFALTLCCVLRNVGVIRVQIWAVFWAITPERLDVQRADFACC